MPGTSDRGRRPRMSSMVPAPLPADSPWHGTTNGYGNLGCRCERCREAHRANHAKYMKRVRASGELAQGEVEHGTSYRYDVGCRCDACRGAHNAKSRITKQRLRERRQGP